VTAVARRHKALTAVVAGGLVAVLAAAAALSLAGGGGQRDGATAAPGVPTLAIGPGTAETVAFADRIWLGSVNGTLTVVDPASRQITQRFDRALPDVTRIAGRGDTAWIGSTGNRLRAFSASAGRPLGPAADAGANVYDLAVTMDALWVADGTRGLVERIRLSRPGVLGARRSVATAAGVSALAVGGAVVWALSPDTGRLFALQAATGAVTRNVRVGVGADALAVAGRDVWVANREAGQLVRVDARSGRVAARRRLPSDRSAVVADGDQAYLIDFAGRRASAIGSSGSLTPVATWKAEAGEAAITGHRLLLTSRESPRATLISLDT
jgi:outer membrane protein assembly factor BamB